ncbi:MAG: serine/threonine protein kinase, partial [Verrucomicrobiales bacterium]|nr:serine/threonine protein kinase [Verrucomicrobiales bacterium]
REVARGLSVAHARGVIHRDLKPQNVVVSPEMRPRILDFGLALTLDEAEGCGRGFEGTPLYASPEQVRGGVLTTASDVFSFGSLMFEVLTGRPPYTGRTAVEVLEAIASTAPPFLRDVAVGVPEDLQAIALACLAWDPGARPTASEVVVELGRYLAGEPVRLRPRLYDDLLRQRVSEQAREVANWEAQGIVSRDERDQLQVLHRRLLADEDHWIIDARRLTKVQTALYTSTWIAVVASVRWVWTAREVGTGIWGWGPPVVATGLLLGAGGWAERRRESLAAASFLAAGALSLAPALLAVLKALGWWNVSGTGVTQFLGTAYSNEQACLDCAGALGVSVWALARLRMTGFAWTCAALGIGTYVFGWMTRGWLDWAPYRQGLACLPLVAMEAVALGFERIGRVRWSFPFHVAALGALVGSLGVMAYDGPTLAVWGVPVGAYFTEDRLRAFSFAANGLVYLGLTIVAERSRSLDLRRAAKVLEVVALVHAEGALYASAQANREDPRVGLDVGLYLATALLFLALGAWRARWRMLVGALGGLALGSYLLVDLGLIPKVPFIATLGVGGLGVAFAVFVYLLRLARTRTPGARAGKPPAKPSG